MEQVTRVTVAVNMMNISPSRNGSFGSLRVGMIGLGKTGKVHLDNLRQISNVSITAIADTNSSMVRERETGIRYVTDYEEVVKADDVDAVVISLPHFLHADAARAAMRNGKHVFLEKPIATTFDDAEELVECAEETGRTLMINMTHRFYPPMWKGRELLQAGAIGEVVAVRDYYMEVIDRNDFPGWFFDPVAAGGGVAMTDSIHLIDRVEWLLGEPLQTVGVHGRRMDPEVSVEDCVEFLCTTASNIPVSIGSFFCFDGPKTFADGLTVFGTRGVLSIHAWSHVDWTPYGGKAERFEGYPPGMPDGERACVGHRAAIIEFVASLRENRPPASEAKAVLNAQRVVQEFYETHPSETFYNVPIQF